MYFPDREQAWYGELKISVLFETQNNPSLLQKAINV